MANKENYQIIVLGIQTEIQEKKSRFLVSIEPVETVEEATSFIEATKKKYWNASHNCSAFIIGSNAEIVRCNDDGEPSGTAGHPMLEVLMGSGVRNVVVVVTRYFGGVLLGTGGLVRAYAGAVKAVLEISQRETMVYGIRYNIVVDYTGIGKVQYLLAKKNVSILNSVYETKVEIELVVPLEMAKELEEELVELNNGKIEIVEIEKCFFIDKKRKV